MILMLRSQKRLTITAGKMTDLSLEGFTTVSLCTNYVEIFITDLKVECLITSDHEIIRVVHICIARTVLKEIVERFVFGEPL